MRRRAGLVAFCCVLLASSSSSAATIEPTRPVASVSYQGQGFQTIFSSVQGNPGDSVMVGPGGLAKIKYEDGCEVQVNPGRIETVQSPSPCAAGGFAQGPDPGLWVAAGGAALGTGFAVCAAIKGCLTSNNNNNNKPLSP